MKINKVLYTASATADGGREGNVKSSDGVLDFRVEIPKEMGGKGGAFTNPEQLFAAGYAACFDSALNLVARQAKVRPESTAVTANVSIGQLENQGFGLAVTLEVAVNGVEKEVAKKLVETAHQVCPYSNATRGNIEVEITVK